MKIAVPSESAEGRESYRSVNFAHAPYFTIATLDDGNNVTNIEVIESPDLNAITRDELVDWIAEQGVDGLIALNMPMQPFLRFVNAAVIVYSDDRAPKVGEVIDRFAEGLVPKLNSTCCSR